MILKIMTFNFESNYFQSASYEDSEGNIYMYINETANLIVKQKDHIGMYIMYINIIKYIVTLSINNKLNYNKLYFQFILY